jgi:DNA polymerase III subunit beta
LEFRIAKDEFLKGLAVTQSVVEKRNTMPILSNILIRGSGGQLQLVATDLEVGVSVRISADITTGGSLSLNAKKLYDIVKELPEGELMVRAGDGFNVEISSRRSRFNVMGLDPEDFPQVQEFPDAVYFAVPAAVLGDMIAKTIFAVSTDETRFNLNGIFIERGNDGLRLVATDGHRLSLVERQVDNIEALPLAKSVIVPRKGFSELRKHLDGGGFELGFAGNNCIGRRDGLVISMRLIDGEFPDYKVVIPAKSDKKVFIDRVALVDSLRRVSLLSPEKFKGVKVSVAPGILKISSSNPEVGDALEELDVEYNGDPMQIGFNARYLLDILGEIGTDKVFLGLNDDVSQGVVAPVVEGVEDLTYTNVVMPMRI